MGSTANTCTMGVTHSTQTFAHHN